MKNILILTDFSIRASYAATFAMHIAAKNHSNIYLAHAIETESPVSDTGYLNWKNNKVTVLETEALIELKEMAQDLMKINLSFKPHFTYLVGKGPVGLVAKKMVKENKIDLVVIGSHQSNTITRFLMGSHTHHVLDEINCPVLLVPECKYFNGLNNIAYATDLTFSNTKVMDFLARLANPFQAKVAVNHISLTSSALKEASHSDDYFLKDFLRKDYPQVTFHTIKKDNVKAGLEELSLKQKPDIIALVHKRYGFIKGLFHQSVSKKMADHAQLPLLVLPYYFSKDVAAFSSEELDHFCFDAQDTRL